MFIYKMYIYIQLFIDALMKKFVIEKVDIRYELKTFE